jgi:NADH-quinone oxidoreductase subunit A
VDDYLPIVVMLVLATGFAVMSFLASHLLGPSKPTTAKSAPYECGIVPSRDPAQRFPVRFYLVAMIFIIFDIEIVFLYPWAVIYRQLDTFGLAEMVVFAIAVFVSFLYLISNGALDWGPPPRLGRGPGPSEVRTSSSTIRRVPRPGALPTVAEAGGAPPAAPVAEPGPALEPVPVGAGGGGSPEAGPAAHSS